MSNVRRIGVILVDDESPARMRLRSLLEGRLDFQVVAECTNGPAAITAVEKHSPDLVFLDVQMPGMNGFQVIENLPKNNTPVIVFVTAYDEYALRAFDACALDYLLKPFSQSRFEQALERAKEQIQRQSSNHHFDQLSTLLRQMNHESHYSDRILVKDGSSTVVVKVDEIDWIEARDNYCCLHRGKDNMLIRDTLTNVERKLNPRTFLRVHRSTVVNIDRIKQLHPLFHKDHRITLADGKQLPLSRTYWEKLLAAFERRA